MSEIESKGYASEQKTEQEKQQKEQNDVIAKEKEESVKLQDEIRLNGLIDKEFENFKLRLLTDTPALNSLRAQRNLSIEKMEDYKLKIKSYGESCEIDLKTGKIYYIKSGERVEVKLEARQILKGSTGKLSLVSSDLYKAFGKMNVINRAMSLAKESIGTYVNTDFYFYHGLFGGKSDLYIGHKRVLSIEGLRKRFGEEYKEQGFLDMFNRLALL